MLNLKDLGEHQLRDLERLERVYQLLHPNLDSDFAALRSESPQLNAADSLADGRQAHASNAWLTAYEALSAARQRHTTGG